MSAFGNSWFGNSWLGNSWFGNSWGPGGGNGGAFAMTEADDSFLVNQGYALSKAATLPDFPISYWNTDMLAQLAILEFVRLDWCKEIEENVAYFKKEKREELFALPNVTAEINSLRMHITGEHRAAARAEIIQQDQNFQLYWLQAMMMSQSSHPATFLLLKIAARVGEIVMIHYKHKYRRPRPSQICPAMLPLLEVPGHASFPSGHSLLAHLTSNCLVGLASWAEPTLTALANRVARNRELAGLHYESDSIAGCQLARVLYDRLLPNCEMFAVTQKKAAEEWRGS
jgi:hypothetical protein